MSAPPVSSMSLPCLAFRARTVLSASAVTVVCQAASVTVLEKTTFGVERQIGANLRLCG